MTVTVTPSNVTRTGVDYGEFTPVDSVPGSTKPWPISRGAQMPEVRQYLSNALRDTGADRVRGLSVLVHWNGRHNPDTFMQINDRTITDDSDGSSFTGESLTEYNLDGTLRRDDSWTQVQNDVRLLHLQYGIKPHDNPPQAPGPEPTA